MARRALAPILALATVYAVAVAGCVLAGLLATNMRPPIAWVTLTAACLLPLVMLAGLVWQRLFMGEALEEFMTALPGISPAEVPGLMAQLLQDQASAVLDPSAPGARTDRSAGLADQGVLPEGERFIRAVGVAASITRENHRLERDLSASVSELAASRTRAFEAADAERQRIERDLHDGLQQRLVGARVHLELADEALDSNAQRGRRMLAEIGCDLDDAIEEVRSLAQGIYPALLETHGLIEALRSVARRAPGPVTVRGEIGRYTADVEVAIYFCCLETLQNVAKHAGREAVTTVRLWQEGHSVCFQTSDSGAGFTVYGVSGGHGLLNMRDRLEALGGTLTVESRVGSGTLIEGAVPLV